MKIFTNKSLIQKLIIAIVAVTLLNFCIVPMKVQASVGGVLANGARDLAMIIADGAISIAQFGITGTWIDAVERTNGAKVTKGGDFWQGIVKYPIIQISPELIFANQIEILSIDFLSGADSENEYIISTNGTGLSMLRTIISSWYVTLRTIAAVGLLSVLIYIGIRIIISSTAQDKAKYKQRIVDWIVAFCLLFFMHYIMAGVVTIITKLDTVLASGAQIGAGIPVNKDYGNVVYNNTTFTEQQVGKEQAHRLEEIKNYLLNKNIDVYTKEDFGQIEGIGADSAPTAYLYYYYAKNENNREIIVLTIRSQLNLYDAQEDYSKATAKKGTYSTLTDNDVERINNYLTTGSWGEGYEKADITDIPDSDVGSNSSSTISVPQNSVVEGIASTTNSKGQKILVAEGATSTGDKILYYINYARLYCNANADNNAVGFGFTAIYIILVVLTIMFLFRYAKRVIYVAFLTLIAPLVALTYPLDKIRDGRAQAFNMWFREYIFNVLIQPFHLLIYTILVGSAMTLAQEHMIYAVVSIAFLIPAEKLLRKFFGFDQAGTLSAAGSFAGGALFSTLVNRLNRPKPKGGNGGAEGKKEIKMNRAPNSSGRVDADATLTGVRNETKATATNGGAGETRISMSNTRIGPDSSIISNGTFRDGGIGLGDGETMTSGGLILPASANDIVEQARAKRNAETNPSETDIDISGYVPNVSGNLYGPDRFGPADRFNGNVSAWDKNSRITAWDRLRGTNIDASDATRGMSKRSAKEYRRKLAEQAAANRAARRADIADAVMGHYKEKAIKGLRELPKNAVRFTRRAVVGGMAGGGLALTGAAVGAASGDAGAAMKLAAAGAGAGYYGANYYGDKIAKNIEETDKVANEAFWNEQNKLHQQQVSDERFENSEENIRMLAQFQGSMEQARESMGNGDVQAFRNEGLSDIKKIGRGLKLMEEYTKSPDGDARHKGLSRDEALKRAISVVKWEDSAGGGLYETNSLAQQKFIANTKKQVMAGREMDDSRAEQEVKDIIRDMSYVRFGV